MPDDTLTKRQLLVERFPIASREEWLALRRAYLTASVVAALFGEHPYRSLFSVYAEKSGLHVPEELEGELLERGLELEDVVGRLVQKRHPEWTVIKAGEFLGCRPPVRLGATPDFYLVDEQGRRGVLQTKVVGSWQYRRGWTGDVPPRWINLQCLTEAMLADASFGWIAALELGDFKFDLHEYLVPRHQAAEKLVVEEAVAFWMSVDGGGPPPMPNYRRDSALIAAMYPKEEPGKILDCSRDNEMPSLLDRHQQLDAEIKDREGEQEEIAARIKERMADAERALVPGYSVTYKQIKRKAHQVKASTYRKLRISKHEEHP